MIIKHGILTIDEQQRIKADGFSFKCDTGRSSTLATLLYAQDIIHKAIAEYERAFLASEEEPNAKNQGPHEASPEKPEGD